MRLKVDIPNNINELTLGAFQDYKKIDLEKTNETLFRESLLELFAGIPRELSRTMERKDFVIISSAMLELLEKESEFQERFKIDGKEFGFIPNLDKITMGEYVDLDTYLSDWDNLHKAMAVMYRPITTRIGKNYLIEKYKGTDKYADTMKKMPLGTAQAAIVFFWTLSKQLLRIIPNYLGKLYQEQNPTTEQQQMVMLLERNGVGTSTYTHLLTKACLKLERQVKLNLGQHLPFSLSDTTITKV